MPPQNTGGRLYKTGIKKYRKGTNECIVLKMLIRIK